MEEVITTLHFYLYNVVYSHLIKGYDILNVGRCAPYQSYINIAECCMSLLNIGLQGLALEREDLGAFEAAIKSFKSMKALCQTAQKKPTIRQQSQQERKLKMFFHL